MTPCYPVPQILLYRKPKIPQFKTLVAPTLTVDDGNGGTDTVSITINTNSGSDTNLLTNGSFETPDVPNGDNENFNGSELPGWDSPNLVVYDGPLNNIAPSDGEQFVELNRGGAKHFYQDISTIPGQTLMINFDHRGREDTETLGLHIGAPGATSFHQSFSASTGVWTQQATSWQIPPGQTTTRIEWRSDSSSNRGNLVDNVLISAEN